MAATPTEKLIIELLKQLTKLFEKISNPSNPENFKSKSFEQLFLIISLLIGEKYTLTIKDNYYLFINNGTFCVSIPDNVAEYLNIQAQLVRPNSDYSNNKCLKFFKASFDKNKLNLSESKNNAHDEIDVIYGIRCRICDSSKDINLGNIKYVGQTKKKLHIRVCKGHTQGPKSEKKKEQPMYKHAIKHINNNTIFKDNCFRDSMEVIILPLGDKSLLSDDTFLRSWECFWQFFLRSRENIKAEGWNQR